MNKTFSIMAMLVFLCGLGCSMPPAATATRPIWAGMIYDISESVTELPSLSPGHVDQLLQHVERRGGAVGFSTVGKSRVTTLRRLQLLPVSGLLNERAGKASANRRNAQDWRAFVVSQLEKPRDEQRTAFNCATQSVNDFLHESVVPGDAERIAVIWSDGKDTAGGCPSVTFPEDVRILVAGMSQDRAKRLGGKGVERFENTDGIVKALGQ